MEQGTIKGTERIDLTRLLLYDCPTSEEDETDGSARASGTKRGREEAGMGGTSTSSSVGQARRVDAACGATSSASTRPGDEVAYETAVVAVAEPGPGGLYSELEKLMDEMASDDEDQLGRMDLDGNDF